MEVFKTLLGLCLILTLFSCAPKTESSTDGTLTQNSCGGLIFQNRFIVEWEDGHTSFESAENLEKFKSDFVQPNLEKIKKFYRDQEVQFLHPSDDNTVFASAEDPAPTFWGQEKVQANLLWDQGIKGAGVTVGIVDSYVQLDHPQISKRIAVNSAEIANNGLDDDGNGFVDDIYSVDFRSGEKANSSPSQHGTHVAGIIAGDPTVEPAVPGIPGMKGMAPEAKIIPAPFILNGTGSGTLSDAINALKYVASRGVQIINNSWGGAGCDGAKVLQSTFLELEKQGILLTVAAGNEMTDIDMAPSYPAAFNLSNQITVSASTYDDVMAYFSNSGNIRSHIAAPGVSIYSTMPVNRYGTMNGTSMAAPFVAGAAALLKSARPQATAVQIKQALLASAEYRPGFQFRVSSRGRMNVAKAFEKLKIILGE